MSNGRRWVFDPDSGGRPIPKAVRRRTLTRLQAYAAEHFAGRFTRLDVRFRGHFCYIDAYTEPDPPAPDWPPPSWNETPAQYVDRLRNTPLHLCRLRFFGDEERWGFAFYTYRNERYSLSMFPDGEFLGTPEDVFQTSAALYLR